MRFSLSLVDLLSRAGMTGGRIFLGLLATLILVSVIGRLFLFCPPFTYEVANYLLVGVVFLGMAYTLKERRHVQVELFIRRFKPKRRAILGLVMAIIGLGWVVPLMVGAWYLWLDSVQHKVVSTSYLHVPLWIPILILVIGATLLSLQLLAEIAKRFPFWRKNA